MMGAGHDVMMGAGHDVMMGAGMTEGVVGMMVWGESVAYALGCTSGDSGAQDERGRHGQNILKQPLSSVMQSSPKAGIQPTPP